MSGGIGSLKMRNYATKLLAHPLFAGSALMVVGSNLGNFFAYVYHLVLGRMLGPEKYSELASILSFAALVTALFSFIGIVVVKFLSSAPGKEVSSYLSWFTKKTTILATAILVLTLIGVPFLSQFLRISQTALFVVPFFLFLFVVGFVYKSFLQGLLKFKELVIASNVELGVRLLLGVLLVWAGLSVFGGALSILIGALIGFLLARYFLGYHRAGEKIKDFSPGKKVLSYAMPIVLVSIAANSLYSTDVLLVKHFFEANQAGIYASLSTLGKIIFFGAAPVSAVMFPMASKNHSLGRGTKKIFALSVLLTIAICAGVLVIYRFLPNLAIGILFGDKYLSASPLLFTFGLFMSVFTLDVLIVHLYLSIGKTKVAPYLMVVSAVVQAASIWILHESLFQVIIVSLWAVSVLLGGLLIYTLYESRR